MKKWIVALVVVLVMLPLQVQAFELTYSGRKDFWTNVQYYQSEDEDGLASQHTDWNFGHSLEFNFNGYGDDGYIMGYITDDPEKMDAVYLDAALGDYKLEWANYKQAFLVPTWFNLRQDFRGARMNYLGVKDRFSLIGVRGENYLREESRILYPGDEKYYHSLTYPGVLTNSVRAWLNGKELQYGADFFVLSGGILSLKIPIKETSHLYLRYVEEGMGYLVYGGRHEHYFEINENQHLSGSMVYLHNRDIFGQNLLGTEWLYQPLPWWSLDVSLGVVQKEPEFNDWGMPYTDGANPSSQSEQGLSESEQQPDSSSNWMGGEMGGGGMMHQGFRPDQWDVNWRLGQQIYWQGLNLAMDYQMIRNNFQNLLYGGKEGQLLNLYGGYQKESLMVNYSQYYNWALDDHLIENEGSFELLWADPHWVHLYFSQYQNGPSKLKKGFAELGYLTENDWGFLTYILGVEMKNTDQAGPILEGAVPYLKLYYEKLENQILETKLYGYNTEQGLQLTRLELSGNWQESPVNWEGELSVEPDYYRTNHELSWIDSPTQMTLNLFQSRNFVQERDYLNLDLQVDLTELLGADTRFNVSLNRDETQGQVSRTYSLGGERALQPALTAYGELSISDDEGRMYAGGLRGMYHVYGWDVNYSWTSQPKDDQTELIQQGVGFSFGTEDLLMVAGQYEADTDLTFTKELKVSYYLLPQVNLKLSYTGTSSKLTDLANGITPWANHQLNIGTAYHF